MVDIVEILMYLIFCVCERLGLLLPHVAAVVMPLHLQMFGLPLEVALPEGDLLCRQVAVLLEKRGHLLMVDKAAAQHCWIPNPELPKVLLTISFLNGDELTSTGRLRCHPSFLLLFFF